MRAVLEPLNAGKCDTSKTSLYCRSQWDPGDMRHIPPSANWLSAPQKCESLHSDSQIECFLFEITPIYVGYRTLWSYVYTVWVRGIQNTYF